MFAAGYAGSTGRPSVKSRAQLQLSRIRDASKNLFRNLHHPVFVGKDDGGGMERAETLARYRDQLLQVLCELQSDLNENVAELRRCKLHKEKMDGLQKQISDRESALKEFGMGLKEAELVLSEGLRKSLQNAPAVPHRAELDVEEVIRYAHTISYTTAAPEKFDPNVPMLGTLPPAPHTSVLAKSRLAATRPNRTGAAGEEGAAGGDERAWDVGRERYPDMKVRMWKHQVHKEGEEGGEEGAAEAGGEGERKRPAEEAPAGEGRPSKAAFSISALPLVSSAAIRDRKKEDGADADAAGNGILSSGIALPEKPARWRPGNPIVIAPDRG